MIDMKKIFVLLAIAAMMAGCSRDIDTESPQLPAEDVPAIVPGEAMVLFTDDMISLIEEDLEAGNPVTKSGELNALAEYLGVTSMTRVFPHAGRFEERTRAEGLHKWYKVTYDPSVPVTKASDDLYSLDGVEFVEPVRGIKISSIFDDPRLPDQWHYINDGTKDGFDAGSDINVLPVWENYTTGNPDVIVAVVDGGIDHEHEDLAANYAGGFNFVRGTAKVVAHDHGTHVAGTVAAVNNNGKGVAGVAGGNAAADQPGVKLLSCQIFEPNPDDPSRDLAADGAEAIKWGADNGAVISQNSWGYVYETDEEQAAAVIPKHLAAAIDYFIKYAGMDENGKQVGPMAGGVVIFAAGNDARADDPIGKYDPVISVGSIGPEYNRAEYSNYGSWVDIAAPGGQAPGMILSTLPANKYGTMKGTSMACPHVSGVAALVVSHFGGDGFTNATLKDKLIKGANASVISKNAKIGPLVDAFGAMTYGGKIAPSPVKEVVAKSVSNSVQLTFDITVDKDDVKAYGYLIVAATDKSLLEGLDCTSLPKGVVSSEYLTGSAKAGDEITAVISDLNFDTSYHIAVAAFDYRRNYSSLSPILQVVTEGNNAPVVSTDYDGDYKIKSHEILEVVYEISDPDGHRFDVSFTPGSDAVSFAKNTDGDYTAVFKGNAADPGSYEAVIRAADTYGKITEHKIVYEILENQAPIIIKDIEDKLFTMPGQKLVIDMNDYLTDPDGEKLNFSISISNKTVLHINPVDNILHATTLGYGLTDVVIVASDSRGLKCTLPFKVLVKDPSSPLTMYPNPVVDYLNVSTMEEMPTHVRILSSTGKVVYDQTSDVSAFEPARIDMTANAPGQYQVTVEFGGQVFNRTIVKL